MVIHLQETGGKNYKIFSKEVNGFIKEITSKLCNIYAYCRGYFDVEYEFVDQYTVIF